MALAGRTVNDARAGVHVRTQDRRVGMVFQDGALLPHRSVTDNVALAVRTGSRAARRERARAALDRVGAAHLVGTLSGGERQRVALARALAGDPQLLLLDEPLSALDHATRIRLRAMLREVVEASGTPALLVSHDLAEVNTLADTVVLFDPGRTRGVIATDDLDPLPPGPDRLRRTASGRGRRRPTRRTTTGAADDREATPG